MHVEFGHFFGTEPTRSMGCDMIHELKVGQTIVYDRVLKLDHDGLRASCYAAEEFSPLGKTRLNCVSLFFLNRNLLFLIAESFRAGKWCKATIEPLPVSFTCVLACQDMSPRVIFCLCAGSISCSWEIPSVGTEP